MPSRTFKTRIDLPAKSRAQAISILNQQLADTTDLFTQVKTAHWNLKGREFIALHKLFDELAEPLPEQADMIAERANALGGLATGTLRQAAAASRLPELPLSNVDGIALVKLLADRFAKLAASSRAAIDTTAKLGDAGTADLFTEIVRDLDKHLWFLEAHVQK